MPDTTLIGFLKKITGYDPKIFTELAAFLRMFLLVMVVVFGFSMVFVLLPRLF